MGPDGTMRYTRYMTDRTFTTATLLALTTALISGVSIFVNKFAVTEIHDPILFAGVKNGLVAVILLGVLVAYKKRAEVRVLTIPQWTRLGLIGLVGGALPFALFFTGLAMTGAVQGALIHKTLFIWVALLAVVFLRERLSALQWLGVSTLFASNLVVGGFQGFSFNMGELLILAATLLWAVENVLAKRALADLSSLTVVSGRMVFGALFLFAYLAVTGRVGGIVDLTVTGVLWTLLTAVFLLGYVVTWYAALKLAPASYVAALLVPATLVTNVLSAVFVTGILTGPQALSGALMVVGTVLVVRFAYHTTQTLDPRLERPSLLR
jgi:drug/metabolite transporter (DMT)-like permease